MPSRRLFNSDSKTSLENLCLSHEELADHLTVKDGLQNLILQNNRDHIISGKQYNARGYVLQLIEHLGRRCTVGEVVAASDGDLTERSVMNQVSKINGVLYALVGIRLTLDKASGAIRMVNDADALMATEKFAARMTTAREEFVRTATAYEQATGKSIGPVLEQIDQQLLAQGKSKETTFGALRNVLTPAKQVEAEVL